MRKLAKLVTLVAMINLILLAPSQALIVKLSDMHSMAKKSDVVVHGIVGDQRVMRDDMGRLVTYSDIEVIRPFSGAEVGDVISIYQVGGQKDGEVMPLIGGHHYQLGQQLIFFGLKMESSFVSFGAGQGKFDISYDEKGEEFVIEDLGNVMALKGPNAYKPEPLVFSDAAMFKEEVKLMIESE